MKIEAGKYYVDRAGEIVGPMTRNPHSEVFKFRDRQTTMTFREDGTFLVKQQRSPRDLLAEYVPPYTDPAKVKALAEADTPKLVPDYPDFADGDMHTPTGQLSGHPSKARETMERSCFEARAPIPKIVIDPKKALPKVEWRSRVPHPLNPILGELRASASGKATSAAEATERQKLAEKSIKPLLDAVEADNKALLDLMVYGTAVQTLGIFKGMDLAEPGSDTTAIMINGRPATWADLAPAGYAELAEVLEAAFNQAARGKGKERHANDKPFREQPIMVIPAMLGSIEGQIYQIEKKAQEANNMAKRDDIDAAKRELYGVINYAAAAILSLD